MNFNECRSRKSEEYICVVDFPREANPLKRLSNSIDLQWLKLSPEMAIVSTAKSAWLHRPHASGRLDRYGQLMEDSDGSVHSTINLLDAAIAAAYYQYSETVLPNISLERWVWQLAGHYHLTCSTTQVMEAASQTFTKLNRPELSSWAKQKASREQDYNRTTLKDIEYLGYDAQAVVSEFYPTQVANLIDYLQQAKTSNPMGCIGYSFTIERIATRIEQEYIQLVTGLLPPSLACLTSPKSPAWLYGSVGVDMSDVQETVEVVARLSAKERISVVKACYETALLCFAQATQTFSLDLSTQPLLESLRR